MNSEQKMSQAFQARIAPVPAEFDDIVCWAAWLYYADQLTQNEIAEVLNVSRATIVKFLQEARERGLVTIRISTEAASRTRLSRAITARFGLSGASIIPTLSGAPLLTRLGDAGARVLADQIEAGDVIGVAWGRTVLAIARSLLLPEGIDGLCVVQASGSSTGSTAGVLA